MLRGQFEGGMLNMLLLWSLEHCQPGVRWWGSRAYWPADGVTSCPIAAVWVAGTLVGE